MWRLAPGVAEVSAGAAVTRAACTAGAGCRRALLLSCAVKFAGVLSAAGAVVEEEKLRCGAIEVIFVRRVKLGEEALDLDRAAVRTANAASADLVAVVWEVPAPAPLRSAARAKTERAALKRFDVEVRR